MNRKVLDLNLYLSKLSKEKNYLSVDEMLFDTVWTMK